MRIFLACFLTVLIETPVLWLLGMRSRDEVSLAVCVNIVTNLTLNLAFLAIPYTALAVLIGETLVVLAEYAVYALAFGRSWRLFLRTLLANALSFTLGLLLM